MRNKGSSSGIAFVYFAQCIPDLDQFELMIQRHCESRLNDIVDMEPTYRKRTPIEGGERLTLQFPDQGIFLASSAAGGCCLGFDEEANMREALDFINSAARDMLDDAPQPDGIS